ncbi:MAG: hypothetical protein HMLKMBBP_02809 [Planctomycetes bacterium]|nr:hypothetical protein [Planctomycetota bacterium]
MLVGTWRTLGEAAARNALAGSIRRAALRASRAARRAGLDADDVVSAAWLRLASRWMRSIERVSDATELDAWTVGVVRIVIADERRSRSRDPAIAGGSDQLATVHARDEGPGDDDARGIDVDALRCKAQAAGATPSQLQAFDLVHVRYMTYFEAAAKLRCDRKTVQRRIERLFARVVRAGRSEAQTLESPSRAWSLEAAADARARGDERSARLFELHASGATHARIADSTGYSQRYVAVKISRERWSRAAPPRNGRGPAAR